MASIHSLVLLFLLGVVLLTTPLLASENPPNDYKFPKRLPAPQRPRVIVPYPREPPIYDPPHIWYNFIFLTTSYVLFLRINILCF
jgi:hypothetical protein